MDDIPMSVMIHLTQECLACQRTGIWLRKSVKIAQGFPTILQSISDIRMDITKGDYARFNSNT